MTDYVCRRLFSLFHDSLTSVGGTNLVPEVAADFSSGGFLNYWARPSYQESAVAQYLDYLGDTNAGLYNASGRAFPDVAAYSVNFDVIYGGAEGPINGTSCSGPTFASIISLLNDELIAAGRPVLGFLNPWLYSNVSSTLTDITLGNNYACSNFTTGFNATTGWDAVSYYAAIERRGADLNIVGYGTGHTKLRQAQGSTGSMIESIPL